MPVTPQKELGWRMEPPVSLPSAKGASRAATQAALPPEGITALVLSDDTQVLRFRRDDDGVWFWQDDATFPLDQAGMPALLEAAAAMTALPSQITIWLSSAVLAEVALTTVMLPLPPVLPPPVEVVS